MVQRLFASLDALGLGGKSALVAFSGGADSSALAVAIAQAGRAGRLRARLAHVEHRVRPDAAGDALVVLGTAERLGMPLSIRAVPDGAFAAHRGVGGEEAMRRERYLLLARLSEETGAASVLTAHSADDQAETVLAHLIRGAGLDGAAGIRASSSMTVPWWPSEGPARSLRLIRPLLHERRSALRALVASVGLDIIEDPTNADVDRTRAALRHDVLPVLERIQPGATAALARFSSIAGEHLTAEPVDGTATDGATSHGLDVVRLRGLGTADQRAAVRASIRTATGQTLSFERTDAIRRWIVSDGVGCVEIGAGWAIRRAGRQLVIAAGPCSGRT